METWCEEVLGVADHLQMERPILVGHSMGGFVAMVTAALYGEKLAGTIIVDSPVRRPDPESEEGSRGRAFRNPKTYASLDDAIGSPVVRTPTADSFSRADRSHPPVASAMCQPAPRNASSTAGTPAIAPKR